VVDPLISETVGESEFVGDGLCDFVAVSGSSDCDFDAVTSLLRERVDTRDLERVDVNEVSCENDGVIDFEGVVERVSVGSDVCESDSVPDLDMVASREAL
jgi:hypothetical protein